MFDVAFVFYIINSFLGVFGFSLFAFEWLRWRKLNKEVSDIFKLVTILLLTYGYSQAVAAYSRHITLNHYLDRIDWFYSFVWLTRTIPITIIMLIFILIMIKRIRERHKFLKTIETKNVIDKKT